MNKMTRRGFLRTSSGTVAGAALLASPVGSMLTVPQSSVFAQSAPTLGQIFVTKKGPVTLHTYVAPAASFFVTTHIIETETALVVVDAQFTQTFAGEAAAYAASLGKPIERHILSHGHPDHWLGANRWGDTPFVSTAAVVAEVETRIAEGGVQGAAGLVGESEVPAEARVPEATLVAGTETIGGVTFTFDVRQNAEAAEQVIIGIPDAHVLIVQDLIYNNVHFFPGQDRDNWIATLNSLRETPDVDLLLVGHGLPTTRGELDEAVAYLSYVQETVAGAASADDIIAALTAQYPAYAGEGILGFWAQFFQPQ